MFSTFTTRGGKTLIIRGQDLRSLEDTSDGCVLVWEPSAGQLMNRAIEGTAAENLARLQAEELEAIDRVQRAQQRQQDGRPLVPVPRGRTRV